MRLKINSNVDIGSFILDTKMKFLRGWIPSRWCQPNSRLYQFNSVTGQLTVKRGGFYWIYGQVRD